MYWGNKPCLKVPQVLLAAVGTCLHVGVAMELGQLAWPQATPPMQAIHVLTDGGLDHARLVELDEGHVGEGGQGFDQLHRAAGLEGLIGTELPYARTRG